MRRPGHLALPFRVEEVLPVLRLCSWRNEVGVVGRSMDVDIGRHPIAFGVPEFLWQLARAVRLPFKRSAALLDRGCRRSAVEHIRLRASSLALVHQPHRQLNRVAADGTDLDAVFLLERLHRGPADLGQDLGCVPGDLPLLLGRRDQGGVGSLGERLGYDRGEHSANDERSPEGPAALHPSPLRQPFPQHNLKLACSIAAHRVEDNPACPAIIEMH